MSDAFRVTLMFGPLAAYFLIQGVWRCGRCPRVVLGSLDFALLALGLGTLVAFGPVGQTLIGLVPASAHLPARLIVLAILWLLFLLAAPPAYRRLLVHNVDAQDLDTALAQTLQDQVPGAFQRTLQGYEDTRSRRGLTVRVGPHTGTVEIETHGESAEPLLSMLAVGLRRRLRPRDSRIGRPATLLWFAMAAITLSLPLAQRLLARPDALDAVRVILRRLVGA